MLSFCGMIVALLHELLVLAQARVHVEEDDALASIRLELVVDDLGLVLRPTPARYFFSASGIPSRSTCRGSQRGEFLPLIDLLLGRLQVVVDVVEVDAGEVGAPPGMAAREVVERLVAELPHPVGLRLVVGDDVEQLVQ